MRPRIFVIAAGIPQSVNKDFVTELNRQMDHIDVVVCRPLGLEFGYSEQYVDEIYKKFFSGLKKRIRKHGVDILAKANLVLIYLDKRDGTAETLTRRFDTEALTLPIPGIDLAVTSCRTPNLRNYLLNKLVEKCKLTIERSHKRLSVIAEEVNNKDNRTCLLLPPRNFGKDMEKVYRCVREATVEDLNESEFKRRIKSVARSLPQKRKGTKTFFVSSKGLVFESPAKAGPRHGMAPGWDSEDHNDSCIVRGKVRFGVSYDQRFHYDCSLKSHVNRRFPSCHGEELVGRDRIHVNIAPNDNVR